MNVALEDNPIAVARLQQIEHDIATWAKKNVEVKFDYTGTHLFSMMELAYSYAKRCDDLVGSIRHLLSQDRIVAATIVGRALIETVATGCFYIHEMYRLIELGDRKRIDDRLNRFYLGVKGKSVEPVHVMDAIRHLEKIDGDYVTHLAEKFGIFTQMIKELTPARKDGSHESPREALSAMKNYDELSEVCHPNGIGTQFLYPDQSNETEIVIKARKRFRSAAITAIWQCNHLLKALIRADELPMCYKQKFLN